MLELPLPDPQVARELGIGQFGGDQAPGSLGRLAEVQRDARTGEYAQDDGDRGHREGRGVPGVAKDHLSEDDGDREADDATGDPTDPKQRRSSLAWKIGYEEGDGAPRRRSRDTTNKRRLRLLGGSTSESLVMRRSAPATSSSLEELGSTLSTGRSCSAESSEDCCSNRAARRSGSERSSRASVAKRGSTSTSSGLTISG